MQSKKKKLVLDQNGFRGNPFLSGSTIRLGRVDGNREFRDEKLYWDNQMVSAKNRLSPLIQLYPSLEVRKQVRTQKRINLIEEKWIGCDIRLVLAYLIKVLFYSGFFPCWWIVRMPVHYKMNWIKFFLLIPSLFYFISLDGKILFLLYE